MTKWTVEEMENWQGVVEAHTPLEAAREYDRSMGRESVITPSPVLSSPGIGWFDVWDEGDLVDNYRVTPYREET
jgi:hypothetical protein